MPIPCKVSLDAGTPLAVSTSVATLLLQGTNSSGKPIRLKRIQLQSNNPGASQQILQINYGFYTTASASGGTTPSATPVDMGLSGIYTPATLFRANTTTLGTTFAQQQTWQWNTANYFDLTEGMLEIQDEIPVSKVWALVIPTAPGAAVSVTGAVNFEEFG
ncbi:MAG: hypothetical protein ACRETL_03845 [Gammaproteobacteria bacterium]